MTIATFRGPVRYVLHNGSADPGPAAAGLVRAGPAVTGNERGPLTAAVPGQDRPADQYLTGWARDFITVLGPPAGPQATRPAINSRLRP